jgi:hypothetical protein
LPTVFKIFITNRGTLDVKLVSLIIWRTLLKHAVKMESVVKFFAVASYACCSYTAWGQAGGPSMGGIPLSIS